MRFPLVLPVLLLVACEPPREGGRLARAVAADAGATLRDEAYASGVDFARWDEFIQPLGPRLDAARSDDEIAAVISEALGRFGASHLAILTPLERDERAAGTRTGPGMTTQAVDGGLLVCAVSEGGPAAEAGIAPGDLITAVGGAPPTAAALSGALGDRRSLSWRSGGTERSATLTLREHRRVSPDRLRALENGVVVISVHSFSDSLYDRNHIKQLFDQAQNAPGVVLDLRSNKGGNAANVEHLISQVVALRAGVCVDIYREDAEATSKSRPGAAPTPKEVVLHVAPQGKSVTTPPDDSVYGGPLVVLVDSQCGSGGELTPFTLQRLGRAAIVGSPTPGKVRIGENFALVGGFELQVPIGEFVASDGSILEGVGVQPDTLLSPEDTARDAIAIPAAVAALEGPSR